MVSGQIVIDIPNIVGIAPLYIKQDGEKFVYPAYIQLDRFGNVSVSCSESGYWEPDDCWSKCVIRWKIPNNVKGTKLIEFLQDATVKDLLSTVHAGHRVVWRNGEELGELSEDAQKAREALYALIDERLCCEDSLVKIFNPEEWVAKHDLSELWPDGDPKEAAQKIIENASRCDVIIDGDVEEIAKALLDKALKAIMTGKSNSALYVKALQNAGMIHYCFQHC